MVEKLVDKKTWMSAEFISSNTSLFFSPSTKLWFTQTQFVYLKYF